METVRLETVLARFSVLDYGSLSTTNGGLLCAPILAFGVGHDGPERVTSSRDFGRDSP